MTKQKVLAALLTIMVVGASVWTAVDMYKYMFEEIPEMVSDYIFDTGEFVGVEHVPLSALPVEAQIKRIFKDDAEMATAIFRAESGLRCEAVSHTGDYGVAQINLQAHGGRWPLEQIKDCTENIKIAYQIYKEWGGFHAWVAFNTGAYLRFLN